MTKIWQYLTRTPWPLAVLFCLFSFSFGLTAKATEETFYSETSSNDYVGSAGEQSGFRFEASEDNITRIDIQIDYTGTASGNLTLELCEIESLTSDTGCVALTSTSTSLAYSGGPYPDNEWLSWVLNDQYTTTPGSAYKVWFVVPGGGAIHMSALTGSNDDYFACNDADTYVACYVGSKVPTAELYYEATLSCPWGFIEVGEECVINDAYGLFFFQNPYTCDRQSTCRINYAYSETFFTPYDYISIYQYDDLNSAQKTLIGTTSIINFSSFGKRDGQSYFTLTGTSTLSGLTYYDIVGNVAEYWNAGTGTTTPATTTIPYVVVVDWGEIPIYDWSDIIGDESTSTENLLGLNTRELACSEEDWTATSSFLGLNMTKTLCSSKKWLLDIGIGPAVWLGDKTRAIGRGLANTFPFGIMKYIKDSWEDSASATLPDSIYFFGLVDQSGNVYLTPPATWTDDTQQSVIIWGPAIWEQENQDLADILTGIRTLTKYLLWAGFLLGIYITGKKVYEELTN